jgi:hypothetical protein
MENRPDRLARTRSAGGRPRLARVVVLAALLAGLAGCGGSDTPGLSPATAERLNGTLASITEAAASGDRTAALAAADTVARRIEQQRSAGNLSAQQVRALRTGIARIRARLLAQLPATQGTTATPTTTTAAPTETGTTTQSTTTTTATTTTDPGAAPTTDTTGAGAPAAGAGGAGAGAGGAQGPGGGQGGGNGKGNGNGKGADKVGGNGKGAAGKSGGPGAADAPAGPGGPGR